MCHQLLVGAHGFLKAGCQLQGGARGIKTRNKTVRPNKLAGGIGNFGDGESEDEEMASYEGR